MIVLKRWLSKAEGLAVWKSAMDLKIEKASEKLSTFQNHRVNVLAEAIISLTPEEKAYLWQAYRDTQIECLGLDPAMFSDFFPKIEENNEFDLSSIALPQHSPAGLVKKVLKGEKVNLSSGKKVDKVDKEKKEEKKEPVKVKTNFDLILKGFTTEGKVKVIKEVKNMMGLGLKEAKEKVESSIATPLVVFKNATPDKAQELLKLFKDMGADVELK
ncbi:hypothetical protein SteCoe_6432 [Stentor coeruleus]|uniref:Large ribosomal subunit protein bL12 C-terminal domain-containing protein n=1 Tax=Stentor coeruleus TaxID=5963 RepID=A0A1R2CPZ5_9CILI|nr:hypothetical protein SteCoe_6432 [Stentor coeruleus]